MISVRDYPVGTPAELAWLADGALHAGDVVVPTTADRLVSRGGTTVVGRYDLKRSTWWLAADGGLVRLVTARASYVQAVISADGRWVAWLAQTHAVRVDRVTQRVTWRVTAYDVSARRVAGTLVLHGSIRCCDLGGSVFVTGVLLDGRVVLADGQQPGLRLWRPGSPLVRVRVRAEYAGGSDPWPLGVSFHHPGDGDSDRFGRVTDGGAATQVGTVSQTALWSPDGQRATSVTKDGEIDVQDVAGEAVVRLAVPDGRGWWLVGWEDAGHVLVARGTPHRDATTTYHAVLRCDAVTGACERVPNPPTGPVVLAGSR